MTAATAPGQLYAELQEKYNEQAKPRSAAANGLTMLWSGKEAGLEHIVNHALDSLGNVPSLYQSPEWSIEENTAELLFAGAGACAAARDRCAAYSQLVFVLAVPDAVERLLTGGDVGDRLRRMIERYTPNDHSEAEMLRDTERLPAPTRASAQASFRNAYTSVTQEFDSVFEAVARAADIIAMPSVPDTTPELAHKQTKSRRWIRNQLKRSSQQIVEESERSLVEAFQAAIDQAQCSDLMVDLNVKYLQRVSSTQQIEFKPSRALDRLEAGSFAIAEVVTAEKSLRLAESVVLTDVAERPERYEFMADLLAVKPISRLENSSARTRLARIVIDVVRTRAELGITDNNSMLGPEPTQAAAEGFTQNPDLVRQWFSADRRVSEAVQELLTTTPEHIRALEMRDLGAGPDL